MEGTEILEHSAEEPSGVGEMGCCESRRWNRGGLIRSAVHIRRNRGYKPECEVPWDVG
jgi:hypothetical protein